MELKLDEEIKGLWGEEIPFRTSQGGGTQRLTVGLAVVSSLANARSQRIEDSLANAALARTIASVTGDVVELTLDQAVRVRDAVAQSGFTDHVKAELVQIIDPKVEEEGED